MNKQYQTKNGKQKIVTFSPNKGKNALYNPEMPDSKLCVLEVGGKFVKQWVRTSNIEEVKTATKEEVKEAILPKKTKGKRKQPAKAPKKAA